MAGMPDPELLEAVPAPPAANAEILRQLRSLRVLANAFCAADLAEPAEKPTASDASAALASDAKLFEVIRLLSEREEVRVAGAKDSHDGVIRRDDLQKLVGRTWLFGIVTFIEIYMTARIAQRWTEAQWSALLPVGRLEKCRQVLAERRRRGQTCELLDCLQLPDKAQLLLDDDEERALFGFDSKTAGKRATGNLELLRNNLAHSQEIVSDHWTQIANLAKRIEQTLEATAKLGL